MKAQRSLVTDLHAPGRRRSRGRTTDVEGTHRQLCSRLTDRLRGDHPDRLADVDQPATRQIASVALRTHAVTRTTADRRTDIDLIDALLLEQPHQAFIQQ